MMRLKESFALYCIFIMLFACSLILYFQSQSSSLPVGNKSSTPRSIQTAKCQSEQPQEMKSNIFFLRTHKTASGTIVAILLRFTVRHTLNFFFPKRSDHGRPHCFGCDRRITFEDLDEEAAPLDNKFNTFFFHTRYQREMNEFFYPDVMRVTILRSPPEQFESYFGFAEISVKLNISWHEFIGSITKSVNSRVSQQLSGMQNTMSRDLGLDRSKFESENEISKFIQFIEEEFHLVMITEHLEASLVLLADLMSWPLHYVATFKIHARTNQVRNNISDEDRRLILRHNRADHLLYEHFLAVFRRRVLEYGFERMAANMQRLHTFNQELEDRCILAINTDGHANTIVYKMKPGSGRDCLIATHSGQWETTDLKEEQISRLSPIKRLHNLVAPTEGP